MTRLVWALTFLLLAAPTVMADEVPYRRYTVSDGLPNEDIHAMVQAADNRLYVGTPGGLAVYNGQRFRRVTFPDSIGAAGVNSLAVDDTRVWASTGSGWVLDLRAGRVVRVLPRFRNVQRLLVRRDTLHIVGERSYWILPPEASQPRRQPLRVSIELPGASTGTETGRGLQDADVGPDGHVWILDARLGLGERQSDGSVEFADLPRGSSAKGWWRHLRFGPDGTALLFGRQTVYRFDPSTGRRTNLGMRGGNFYFDGGLAYVPSRSGVARLTWDGGNSARMLAPLDEQIDLPNVRARCVLRDHEGGLWVGTQGGLLHLFAPDVRHLSRIDGATVVYVDHFSRDSQNHLWVNTWGSGLIQLRPERARVTPRGATRWLTVDSRDENLHALSTDAWLRRESGGEWRRVAPSNGAVRGVVNEEGIGFFWHNRGLYRHEPTRSAAPERLLGWNESENGMHAHTLASNGDIILRAGDVLMRGSPPSSAASSVHFDTLAVLPDRFAGDATRFIAFDRRGAAWLAFRHRGLVRVITTGDSTHVEPVVPDRAMLGVTLSGDSLVFAGSRDGLYVLNQANGTVRRHLTAADGLLATSTQSATIFGDTLYASHPRGVTAMPVRTVFRSPASPEVLLTRIHQQDEVRSPQTSVKFDSGDRTVGFGFAATAFKNPRAVVYEYRLRPRERSWASTRDGFTRYVDLPPGSYRFQVRAKRSGAPAGPPSTYRFTIPRFFYETTWFRLLCLVLLGVGGLALYRWRVRTLHRRQRQLEEIVTDRTEQLREEKQKTEEQAERLAELDEAKNRFFANLSHEFRTPLTLILEPLGDAIDGTFGDLPEALEEQLRLMRRNARRLEHLIEQLLDLTQLDAGRMEVDRQTGDLVAFTRELVQAFTPLAERERVALHFRADADQLWGHVDPEKIEQVLSNLLSNALEYTPEEGKVWVTITADTSGSSRVAELVVKDTGPGLTEEELRQIFDRFEQARSGEQSEREGLGLGLALANELVELHDGTLRAESEPGFGTAFTVRLPLGDVDQSPGGDGKEALPDEFTQEIGGSNPSSVPPGNGIAREGDGAPRTDSRRADHQTDGESSRTVLIVEDNADMRAYLRRHLAADYTVLNAENGAEALQIAREHDPDLVVSDVMMPKMSGTDLCEAMKSDNDLRAIPIVLLTAKATSTDVIEGLERGADAYLTKPFDIDELRARIERLLSTRRELRDRFSDTLQVQPSGPTISEEEAPFLERVLSVMEDHLGDSEFRVDDLAAEMALSRRQLTRRVKETTGETPAALMRRLRLQRAAQLLKQDERTVSEIAYAVGYTSSSHFAKLFRKQFGCLPSEYEGA